MLKWFEKFRKIERIRRLSVIFGLMIVVGLIFVALGVMASIKVTPYKTYTNKQEGISIKFPAYWEYMLNPAEGSIVAFIAPSENSLDTMRENLNISIKIMPQNMTIEYLSDMIVRQVTGTFGEQMDVSRSVPRTLAGKPGYRFTFHGYGSRIPNPVQYVIAWTVVGNRVYILTFTGFQKDYPRYEKIVEEMIRSFKFIPRESP